ncbi:MAG: transglycosylase domain-containing protein, partial [Candidatus Dormibacteria bacterium]
MNAWQTALGVVGGLVLLVVLGLIAVTATLPDPSKVQVRAGQVTLLDRGGKPIEVIAAGGEVHRVVKLSDISPLLQNATIAAEDRHFRDHHGIDFGRLLKAMTVDVIRRRAVEGASTITQQLAKVELLGGSSADRSLMRKVKEAILATEIEQRFSKDEILGLYLNSIYYGHHAYGIEAASRVYFDKRAKDLTLGQAALLAGLPQAPTYYDPAINYTAAKKKQEYVLDQMVRDGFVSRSDGAAAVAADLQPQLKYQAEAANGPAPHFAEYVLNQLVDDYGSAQVFNGGGLKVYTSLD